MRLKNQHFTLLIPLKDFSETKSRLSSVLDIKSRKKITLGMLKIVIDAAKKSNADNIVLVGTDNSIKELGEIFEVDTLFPKGDHLAHDMDIAASYIKELGDIPIYIPSDLPLLNENDINQVVQFSDYGQKVVLVPSSSDGGTNCIAFNLGSGFYCQLGENSFQKHLDECTQNSISYRTIEPRGMLFDLDTVDDFNRLKVNYPLIFDSLINSN
tara:strand:+ start:834 stop:1469 length:636 start_codon:yes stop_codon:yes gene_type:complete